MQNYRVITTRRKQLRSRRLELLSALIPRGSRVADIGTGHGRLAASLVRSGHVTRCIASEKTARRLAAARADAGEPAAGPEWRHGDGLDVLTPEDRVEVAVLAGMGGPTILGLIDRAPPRLGLRRLVLQPQTEVGGVRRGITDRGWTIVDERIATEGRRFYFLIAAEPGSSLPPPVAGLTRDEVIEVGPCLLRAPDGLLRQYWSRQLDRLERILARPGTGPAREAVRSDRNLAKRVLRAVDLTGQGILGRHA